MDNRKSNHYFIERIITDLEFIVKHTEALSEEAFYQNELLQDSVMFRMIQISENIKKLTDYYKNNNQNIPWVSIIGLRN